MAEKYYNQNPKVNDTVVFDLYTPDSKCLFISDPFEVVSITVYFIERNFVYDTPTFKNINIDNKSLEVAYLELKQRSYEEPDNENLKNELKIVQRKILQTSLEKIEFDNLIPVATYGSKNDPVWTPTKKDSIIKKVTTYGSKIVNGHFEFKFQQDGLRDGDYFLKYTWRPNTSLQKLSSSIYFSLYPSVAKYIAPKNLETDKNKYPNLLNRYLPEVYKNYLSNTDLSPEVLEKFNNAVGDAFAYLETLGKNVPALLDPNLIPEFFLAYLGILYQLSFKSNDPIRWRRQIAKAVPNFKMKGTIHGLRSALGDAGIILKKFTHLYQIYSSYTWNDVFYISKEEETKFTLSKISLPINDKNFAVYFREKNTKDFIEVPLSSILIETENNISYVSWLSFKLKKGDSVKILYQFKQIESEIQQTLEYYIRNLPLADLRNDLEIIYPIKNWNAKVIEEDDPFINEIIPFKNPFHDPVVFGKIRTEFPYSENIYNMDEYNGSLRDSNNPCDIDKTFIDPCSGFITTLYNLNLEIESLNSERIQEAFNILKEFTPFHSVLHSLNYSGFFETIILPPEEKVDALITYKVQDNIIAGNAQQFFNRDMFYGLLQRIVRRDALAIMDNLGNEKVQAYNKEISLFAPLINFSSLSLSTRQNTYLEILDPSPNAGTYTVFEPNNHLVKIYEEALVNQPVNQSEFAFRLSNINFSSVNFSIKQESIYTFSDDLLLFEEKENNITTVLNVKDGTAKDCWKIKYYINYPNTFNIYNIYDINSDGSIILENDGSLPFLAEGVVIDEIKFDLLNENNNKISFSANGVLKAQNKGLVNVDDVNINGISEFIAIGNYFHYLADDLQYVILSYGCNPNEFYISNWDKGNMVGVTAKILKRIVSEATGNLTYNKIIIEKPNLLPNFENPNSSGSLDNNTFKENFIITIDNVFYKIVSYFKESSVDYLEIEGLPLNLGTKLSGGTTLNVNCKQFKTKENIIHTITLNFDEFVNSNGLVQVILKPTGEYVISCDLNRSGANMVSANDENLNEIILCDNTSLNLENINNSLLALNNTGNKPNTNDIINQEENVSFIIETKDGKGMKGKL